MGEKTTLLHLIFAQNRQKCAILPQKSLLVGVFCVLLPLGCEE